VDLLAITAYYHADRPEQQLDIGHTIPIGAPWLDDSACDHLLLIHRWLNAVQSDKTRMGPVWIPSRARPSRSLAPDARPLWKPRVL
jgi:hypothetical protein